MGVLMQNSLRIPYMKKLHLPTLIAISIIAWAMVNIIHEILGHAGVGLLSGFQIKAVNTTTAYLDVDWEKEIAQNGFDTLRLFLIGGVLLNFMTGLISILILRFSQSINAQARLFLWLFSSFSYVVVVMNLITAPLTGGGDLAEIIRTYEKQDLAQLMVLIVGIFIAISGYLVLQKTFMPSTEGRRSIRISLVLFPVLTIIALQTLSVLQSPFSSLPPAQNHLIASIFAYFHFLIWAFAVMIIPSPGKHNLFENSLPNRSVKWMIFGTVVTVFYLFIFGPGIGSFEGHPLL
jgi:hypothetical protein